MAQADQFRARLRRGAADIGADLDRGSVQLGLDVLLHQRHLAVRQQLRDIRLELTRLRIDNLVLLFDSDAEGWLLGHESLRPRRCLAACSALTGDDDWSLHVSRSVALLDDERWDR